MQRSILALITGSLLLGLVGAATKVQSQSLASVSMIALQGQSVSRWQEERFGPIVSTDTLWTISTYYGQKQGISIYAMMDLIVAANPRVFINGDPDRMMDGYFLTIPNLDRRASDTTTESSEAAAGDAVVDNTAIATPDPVETAVDAAEATLSAEEMDSLRSNLAESITLIENLQRENVDLQERLRAVNSELAELKQRVDIEDAADAELRQLTDEVTAIAAAEQEPVEEPASVENADAEVIVDESRTDETMSEESLADVDADASESAAGDDSAATAAEPDVETAAVEPMLDADEEVTKESATAATSESESSASATIPNRGASKRQAPSFIDWLLQPYQLALAILVPLLIAAIIWYVIYVRRVNREIAGTYNGARQAAERDKQDQLDEEESASFVASDSVDTTDTAVENDSAADDVALDEESLQDETDETTSIAVDDPLWSESDEETSEFDIEVVDSESTPKQELDEASDEDIEAALADLNWSLDDATSVDAETSETAADAAESESETDTSLDSMPDLELEQAPEPEPEIESEPEPEPEPELEPEPEPHSNEEDDMASTHDVDLIDIETLLEEADAEANDDVEDRYSTDDVKEVLGESDESTVPSATDLEDDFEMGKSPATLLDLAQAYIEMGEVEDAQILLNKIKHCGDDDIEREVAQLLQNLDGQSHR